RQGRATWRRWFGLWMECRLATAQQAYLLQVLTELNLTAPVKSAICDLRLGLRAAIKASLPLHVQLCPRGHVAEGWWRLAAHCPRCKAVWNKDGTRGVPATYGHCRVCGYVGHPAQGKKRRPRGRRPYAPLARLLG